MSHILFRVEADAMYEVIKNAYLELTNLKYITDEHAIEVAKLSSQNNYNWIVTKRDEHMIHLEYLSKDDIWYHVGIDHRLATICTNMCIGKESYDMSIGRIHRSSRKPIPYIAILGLFRKNGYAVPFDNYSVEQLIEERVLKYKTIQT
jgi:hypothetical protein